MESIAEFLTSDASLELNEPYPGRPERFRRGGLLRETRFVTSLCRLPIGDPPLDPNGLLIMQVEHLIQIGALGPDDAILALRDVLLDKVGLGDALNLEQLKADRQRIVEMLDRVAVHLDVPVAAHLEEGESVGDRDSDSPSAVVSPTIESLNSRFFELLYNLTQLSKQVIKGGSPRDKVNLFAWVEQSASAVTPDYLKDIELFHFFVRQLVLLVIIFDDITEASTGDDFSSLLSFLGRIVKNRLSNGRIQLEGINGFSQLSELHKEYAYLVQSVFDLYDDTVEALCPVDSLKEPELSQISQVRAAMLESLKDLFKMIDFSSRVDAQVRAVHSSVVGALTEACVDLHDHGEMPTTDEWVNINKAGTQMRHMLLASFLQRWGTMSTEEREKYDFEVIFRNIIDLGDGIDMIGNLSNDFATLLRELFQENAANAVTIFALNEGMVTAVDVRAAFREIQALGSERANELMISISRAFFAGNYNPDETFGLERGSVNNILALVAKLLAPGGAFDKMLDYWKAGLDQLKEKFTDSPLANFMNVSKLLDAQLGFLRQYAAVSGNI